MSIGKHFLIVSISGERLGVIGRYIAPHIESISSAKVRTLAAGR
jgi:hypothetical protein